MNRSLIAIAALVAAPFASADNLELVCKDPYGRVYEQNFIMKDMSFVGSDGCDYEFRADESQILQSISCPAPHPNRADKTIRKVERKVVSRTSGMLRFYEYDDWGYAKVGADNYVELSCEKATKKF